MDEDLKQFVETVTEAVKDIRERIETLEAKPPIVEKIVEKPGKIVEITDNTGKYPDNEVKPVTPTENYVLIDTPIAWRNLISEQLGADFEVSCVGFADRPKTRIDIVVPERYWSGKPEEIADRREKGKKDTRSVIVDNSMAMAQLKDRVQKIKENIAKGVNASSEPLSRLIKE
jgi:hypothetical protein